MDFSVCSNRTYMILCTEFGR